MPYCLKALLVKVRANGPTVGWKGDLQLRVEAGSRWVGGPHRVRRPRTHS